MKCFQIFILASALAVGIQQADATILTSGTLSVNQAIPDDNPTGYSTSFSGFNTTGAIADLRLTLNISGGFNGDLYAYLTHDGATAILLNRIGTSGEGTFGNSSPGMNVTFTLDAASNIHDAPSSLSALTGFYLADGRNADPGNLNAVSGASSSSGLNNLVGKSSSGEWTLFIADLDGGAVATLNSWELEIVPVPEPTNVALGVFGGMTALLQGFRSWKARNLTQKREDAKE